MKNATAGCATGLVGPFISALILTDGLLGLAGIYLGGECLTCANGFTGNGPDIGILHLGMNGCLEHLLEDLALVGGHARLRLAVFGEMGAKPARRQESRPSIKAWQMLMGSSSWSMNGREAARI